MSNEYLLFLDDYRDPLCLRDLKTWEVVRNYNEFVEKITKNGLPKFISFDHDLSWEHYPQNKEDYEKPIDYNEPRYARAKTGYHCAQFLIEYCQKNKLKLPAWQVHSMNPVGRVNINQLLTKYKEFEDI